MQLELDFTPAATLQQTAKDFFDNCYGILIWMQIINKPI
jgi:hypothetical protein